MASAHPSLPAALDALEGVYHLMGEAGQAGPAAAGTRLVADARRAVQQVCTGDSGWAGPVARALGPLLGALGQQQQPGGSPPSPGPRRGSGPPALHVIWALSGPAGAEGAAGGGTAEACWTEAQQRLAGEALECLGPLLDDNLGVDPQLPGLLVALHGLIMLAARRCAPGLVDVLALEVGVPLLPLLPLLQYAF